MWWNDENDILDIIAGAKERLLDAAGFAAEIEPDEEVLRSAVEFFRLYERALRMTICLSMSIRTLTPDKSN